MSRMKTEHTGGKNGGGHWGTRDEAKTLSKSARRRDDKASVSGVKLKSKSELRREQIMTNPERMSKYWICNSCALERGWKKTGNTITTGLCGWCDDKEEGWLTPLRDLKNEEGVRADCTPEGGAK